MGGIIADNVGRSSGLIKAAAAPAGTVLVDSAYASASGTNSYTTWAGRGTGSVGGSYGEWGGTLAGSSLGITWGSLIAFPSTGVYQIWATFFMSNQTSFYGYWDDGSYSAENGFLATRSTTSSGGYPCYSYNFALTVDDISNDKLRVWMSNSVRTGLGEGSGMIIAKFE